MTDSRFCAIVELPDRARRAGGLRSASGPASCTYSGVIGDPRRHRLRLVRRRRDCSRSKLLCWPGCVRRQGHRRTRRRATPGSASTRRFSSSQNASMRAGSWYCAPGKRTEPVSTCSVSKPRSTCFKLIEAREQQGRDDRAAAWRSRTAPPTSARRRRRTPTPAVDDRLDRSDSSTVPPVAFNAGTRPNSSALDIASAEHQPAPSAHRTGSRRCAGK